eukprot:c18494_g1_i1 orf=186-374(+)
MPAQIVESPEIMTERKIEKPTGRASVLAIGTANPPNVVEQSTYSEFYFNVTNNNHMTNLKKK